jgi:signal peptidase I
MLQFYRVSTASNEPSLHTGGLFFTTNLKKPKRFDFICYRQAESASWPEGVWVKRVCGLPGDKVRIIDGVLNVNGQNADADLNLKKTYIISASEANKLDASDFRGTVVLIL